jgi:hypothetical protein
VGSLRSLVLCVHSDAILCQTLSSLSVPQLPCNLTRLRTPFLVTCVRVRVRVCVCQCVCACAFSRMRPILSLEYTWSESFQEALQIEPVLVDEHTENTDDKSPCSLVGGYFHAVFAGAEGSLITHAPSPSLSATATTTNTANATIGASSSMYIGVDSATQSTSTTPTHPALSSDAKQDLGTKTPERPLKVCFCLPFPRLIDASTAVFNFKTLNPPAGNLRCNGSQELSGQGCEECRGCGPRRQEKAGRGKCCANCTHGLLQCLGSEAAEYYDKNQARGLSVCRVFGYGFRGCLHGGGSRGVLYVFPRLHAVK